MWLPANPLQFTFRLGLAMAALGFTLALWPSQDADPLYYPRLPFPAFSKDRPLILVDEAHTNTHTMEGRFLPLMRLARADGYRLAPNMRRFSDSALQGSAILIVGNPLGWAGAAQQLLNLAGLEGSAKLPANAFRPDEVAAVREWVRSGGSLLLTADHAPCGMAAQSLASQFGVTMTNGYTEDPVNHDPKTGAHSFLLFTRENGLLQPHPITEGREPGESVTRVATFTGQALEGPATASTFLKLSSTAVDYARPHSTVSEAHSVAGLAQGLALEFGNGRVVVLGDTSMITAQRLTSDGREILLGMNNKANDNQRLALNILHWLSRLI